MSLKGAIKRFIGGLNLTKNYSDLPSVDYVDGYDLTDRNGVVEAEDGLLQPENNTKFAYELKPYTETRRKIYKVDIDLSTITQSCTFQMQVSQTNLAEFSIGVDFVFGTTTAEDFFDDFTNEIFVEYPLLDETIITEVDINNSDQTISFLIEFVYFGTGDYFIDMFDTVGEGTYKATNIQDPISVEKLGKPIIIAFDNANEYQQVYATTGNKRPSQILLNATLSITDSLIINDPDDELIDGEEIYLIKQFGNIGGYVVLSKIAPTQYEVVGSVDPLTGLPYYIPGLYIISRNQRTLSTIYMNRKDYQNDNWQFELLEPLVETIRLNFRSYKLIESRVFKNAFNYVFDWTDGLNPMRRMIYPRTDILPNGFIGYYNQTDLYDLDLIERQSNLQFIQNTSKVKLSVPYSSLITGRSPVQGAKPEAGYVAFVRYKTYDGAYSSFSHPSNAIWLRGNSLAEHKYGNSTNQSIAIDISQIPQGVFEYIDVAVIEFNTETFKAYLLPEQPITGEESVVIDTGLNPESYRLFDANNLLEQIPFVFEFTRNLINYNSYLITSNVRLYEEYDLREWAQDIVLEVERRNWTVANDIAPQAFSSWNSGINDFLRISNEWMSLMPYDTYRWYIAIDWENGAPTSYYWINDLNTDIGAPHTITDTSTVTEVYQYYVKASGINLNYLLPDGKILRDVVKDIRFARALCNSQVISNGLALSADNPSGFWSIARKYRDTANPANPTRLLLYDNDMQNLDYGIENQAGDYIEALEVSLQNALTLFITSQAIDFYGNLAGGSTVQTKGVVDTQFLSTGQSGNIMTLQFPIDQFSRKCTAIELDSALTIGTPNRAAYLVYYIRPYSSFGAYPEKPESTRCFIVPQDIWFDKKTHQIGTEYKIFGGDCFPQKSYYKIEEDRGGLQGNSVVGFYSYSRTNPAMRSGYFPSVTLENYIAEPYLTGSDFKADRYTYDGAFTPRYVFQNAFSFNPNLFQESRLLASIFYSQKALSDNLPGANRLWLPLDRKDLELNYGEITHMDTLLGFSEAGILVVLQRRRLTMQYFDNSANLITNSGQLLIGSGDILERRGVDLTEYGCEYKWTVVKGQSDAGKDILYYICFRKSALVRLGADGTRNIVADLSTLFNTKGIKGLYEQEKELDPYFSTYATWNNMRKEYIVTFKIFPNAVDRRFFEKGDYMVRPDERWGFEGNPTFYKSRVNNNPKPIGTPNPTFWEKMDDYNDFVLITLVWNELDNKFKTYRSYQPNIYGIYNNNYVSAHPLHTNLVYEHNDLNNEALYYCTKEVIPLSPIINIEEYRIEATGIGSYIDFDPQPRKKYVVKLDGKNYEIVGVYPDYLQMASVDDDDILPNIEIRDSFEYYICNSQDPYITGIINEGLPSYNHYVGKQSKVDFSLKRTEYLAAIDSLAQRTTQSFTNKSEEEFWNGESNVQIKMDTTDNLNNNESDTNNNVEGYWMKMKNIFRWGKKNRMLSVQVNFMETEKKK
jgi:hypothetical protein